MRNIHSAMYSGPIGQFAKYAQDPWAKNQDHNFIASTFGMSPNDSAYSENVVDSTATPNGAIATPVPSMNVVGTPLAPIGYPSNPIDGSLDTSNSAISNAMAADAAGNAAAAATGNYGSITDFGGVGPSVSGGGTSSGDAGVSGANSESSHSADGNNSGSDSGGFGGGTGDSEGDDGWYKGGKVTKNRLKGMNPPGPDDGYGALQDGEYVVSKKAVDKYGTGLLGKINSGKMSKKRKG